jgi:hypothetical protein
MVGLQTHFVALRFVEATFTVPTNVKISFSLAPYGVKEPFDYFEKDTGF